MSTIQFTCHVCGRQSLFYGRGPYKCPYCGANLFKEDKP